MKKIVSLLIAVMMISTVALGAEISNTTKYENKTITIDYTGVTAGEQATVMAYTIAENAASTDWDGSDLSIIGLEQEASDGKFVIPLDKDYTGKIGVYVGSASTNSAIKYVISIASGLPTEITAENVVTLAGKTYVLASTETVKIDAGESMNNVTIDATTGSLKYLNANGVYIDLEGKINFNAGVINPVGNKAPITLSIAGSGASTKTVGFIWADTNISSETYSISVSDGSTTKPVSIAIPELLRGAGNIKFSVAAKNVPESSTLTISLP